MNSKRNRKSLDDALAQQFIYGEQPQETKEATVPEETSPKLTKETLNDTNTELPETNPTKISPNELLLIDKLKASPKEATIRFTVDLPQSTHRKLSLLAAMTSKTKAEIVRVLLNEALEDAGF